MQIQGLEDDLVKERDGLEKTRATLMEKNTKLEQDLEVRREQTHNPTLEPSFLHSNTPSQSYFTLSFCQCHQNHVRGIVTIMESFVSVTAHGV